MINPERVFGITSSQTKPNEAPPAWEKLIEIARWCPSVHNLQPHRLKIISETEADLHYDPTCLLPVEDPHSIFAMVAMGIFVENLSIVAAKNNYEVQTIKLYEPIATTVTECTRFAKLKLIPRSKKEEINEINILKRRTSRTAYDGAPLKPKTLQRLYKEAHDHNQEFNFSHDDEILKFIEDLDEQTLFKDLKSKETRKELDSLFRYNRNEAERHRNGLWTKCMGFSGRLVKSVFKNHQKWSKGVPRKILSKQYRSNFKGTKTICWINSDFKNKNDYFKAGKSLARLWLILTEDGAYLQPLGSLITNTEAHKQITKRIRNIEDQKTETWMIFRAGYSNTPTKSYRFETEQLIIK